MAAKVGTGELKAFKDSRTGSTTISNATDGAHRDGFTENFKYTKATRNVTELTAFKTGPDTPGLRQPLDIRGGHPEFKERDNGIAKPPPAFSEKEASYPKGFKGGID